MANLPEKNVVLVDKITNVPTDSNLFINANGEFKQASVNDVVNSSTVVSTAVETAINTAVQDSIDSNFKQTSGSPILLTDSADGTLIDFKGKGRSTQNGTPTPDSPIAIKSVADSGYFDGELLQGAYNGITGLPTANTYYIRNKNSIPCKSSDTIKLVYGDTQDKLRLFFYKADGTYINKSEVSDTDTIEVTAPTDADNFNFDIVQEISGLTPTNAKPITVTINGKYALIVKSKGKNLLSINERDKATTYFNYTEYTNEIVKGSAIPTTNGAFLCSFSAYLENGKTYFFSQESTNLNSVYIYSDRLWGNNIAILNVINNPNYTHNAKSGIYVIGYYGGITSGTEYSIVKPMLRRAEVTDDTYEPYKEEVKYIPLNEPLRSSLDGTVTDEVSLTEVTRRFTEVVFDGSDDEGWSGDNRPAIYIADIKNTDEPIAICTHFKNVKFGQNVNEFLNYNNGYLYFNVDTNLQGLTKWKAWLQANPITVIYELAEPITETIEPVDIVTYDNVTYLTASDNAEMEIEYPTTKVAGIASIGYSKGIKAEYETEQLKKQLLEIQATIVNTL